MHPKHQIKNNWSQQKILQSKSNEPQKPCHFLRKLPNECNDSKFKQKRCKGICKTTFRRRYINHKKSFNLIKYKSESTLCIEYWTLKQKQRAPRFTWEITGQYKVNNPTLKKFNLCLNEKLTII